MNIMKAFLLTAPAAAVMFMYVIYMQQEHKLRVELENARFDREWSEFQAPGNSQFWETRKREAERRENETAKELEERKKKLKEFEIQFEKTFNETQDKGV